MGHAAARVLEKEPRRHLHRSASQRETERPFGGDRSLSQSDVQFADEAVIKVISGKGGNGCVSFRREKYIPNGGPNGGDGGRGGDVIFCVKRNLRTLAHLRFHPIFKARNGGDGMSWNKFGKDGEDVVIPVPPGTIIRDNETNEIIHDFKDEDEDLQFVLLHGGKGGWGNWLPIKGY